SAALPAAARWRWSRGLQPRRRTVTAIPSGPTAALPTTMASPSSPGSPPVFAGRRRDPRSLRIKRLDLGPADLLSHRGGALPALRGVGPPLATGILRRFPHVGRLGIPRRRRRLPTRWFGRVGW